MYDDLTGSGGNGESAVKNVAERSKERKKGLSWGGRVHFPVSTAQGK